MNAAQATISPNALQPTVASTSGPGPNFDQILSLIGVNIVRPFTAHYELAQMRWLDGTPGRIRESAQSAQPVPKAPLAVDKRHQKTTPNVAAGRAERGQDPSTANTALAAYGPQQTDSSPLRQSSSDHANCSSAESTPSSSAGQRAGPTDAAPVPSSRITIPGEQAANLIVNPSSGSIVTATTGVFSMLPVLLERSGRTRRGSISGFYAVLVEGDELTDPMPDTGWPQHQAAMARVIRGLQSALNQNGGSVNLRLSPPEIGDVRSQLEVTEGVVRAQLWTENVSVQSLLRQQVGHLHNALESHGLTIDRLEVQTMQQNSSSFIPDQTDEQNIEDEGRSRGRYAPDQHRQWHQDHPSPVQTFEQELNVVA